MYKATKYLIDHGHKEIGFVGTIELSDNIRDRYFGYLKAMKRIPLPCVKNGYFPTGIWLRCTAKSGCRRICHGFACSSDYTAGLLYDALMKKVWRFRGTFPVSAMTITFTDIL